MDAERARSFLLALPHVVETEQWGGLVYWVGDRAIGGRMFAMMNPDGGPHPLSLPVGKERFAEMLEIDGLIPAPYMARIFWVSAERWDVFRTAEWQEQFTAAHALTYAKLPPKTKRLLDLPKADLRRIVAERRKVEAAKKAAEKPAAGQPPEQRRAAQKPAARKKAAQ
jgi:predicted DNA-binding protein (MmcQ/YjbR family)